MCSCCCPPAVDALFCLWFQSGCSKGTVAGALTFFPPDPPLYKFERYDSTGKLLPTFDEEEQQQQQQQQQGEEEKGMPERQRDETDNGAAGIIKRESDVEEEEEQELNGALVFRSDISMDGEQGEDGEIGDAFTPPEPREQSSTSPSSPKNKNSNSTATTTTTTPMPPGNAPLGPPSPPEKQKSPAQQLTERQAELRRRARRRYLRDVQDHGNDVVYRIALDPRLSRPPAAGTIEALKIPSLQNTNNGSQNSYIATLIYRVPHPTAHTKTIIYSHANATDIGAMFALQAILVNALGVNVVMYDYSGYGESGGVAMEQNTYSDIRTVYEYTKEHLCRDPHKIILYGQSVGSGPTCYLAYKNNEVGGVILHSPFLSGMRVLTPSRILGCLDIYPNINRIRHVRCPVMIIHGKLDEEVGFQHGVDLHEAVPSELQRDPWWVNDRGHNDVTDGKMQEYVQRLQQFLESME